MSLKNLIKAIKSDQRISPAVQTWFSQNQELVLSKHTASLIAEQMVKVPRDRSASFSSSSRGDCHRKQVFGYLGAPTSASIDTKLRNIFLDGHWRHHRWQALLLHLGVLTHIESPWEIPELRLKGSLDGVNAEQEWGFELKGINDNGYKNVLHNGPLHKHLLQIHTYMVGTGMDEFALVYENKNTNDFVEFTVHKDDDIMGQVMDELGLLNDSVDTKTLPPMLIQCQETPDYQCAYREHCPKAGARWK
ncbi:hypothetical protein UFOVP238_19 [uncultured Caudovirales phage]|uniref:Uncharacterized protein n=1 Tax=uncultured Caudovirales phage TaxID=2100421 RepID=A0A6J7WQK2_9CAUD|nr:hypothetical protein UFOVP238_19 [uncultured Caudovirales phage]